MSLHTPAERFRRLAVLVAAAAALLGGVAAGCSSSEETSSSAPAPAAASPSSTTASTAPAQNAGQEVERFNDPTAPVEVTVGQTFQITFPADAGNCFSWDLTTTDSPVVSLVTSRPSAITDTADDPALTGESDTDVFEFTANEAGQVDLAFSEISPCEPGTTEATKSVTVIVTAS